MKWRDRFNKKYMQISLYVIITCVIIYSLSLVAKNAPVILSEVMEKLNWLFRVIKPIILGFAFAYLLDPVVAFFEKRFRRWKVFRKLKHPRTLATIISVVLLFFTIAGLISMLAFSVTAQLHLADFDDLASLAEEYIESLNDFTSKLTVKLNQLNIQSEELQEYIADATSFIVKALKGMAESLVNTISNISGYLTTIIFSFIIGFYFLIDGKMIMEYIRKVFRALFSDGTNKRVTNIIHDLDYVFSGYIRGQLSDAFLMMLLISLILSIIGVKFGIVIGIFAGIGNLIPYVGPIVAYVCTAIVCLINGEIKTLIIAIIALVIIQVIDGNFMGPKLLSKSIKIHPLIIIISLIFGSAIGGFLGMLLAVPMGAYIKLVFVRFIDNRVERKQQLSNDAIQDDAEGKTGQQDNTKSN